ncbi:hypothetical protein F8M41_016575 [Gigaspora margarita]|uniref:Uncharacterized protein n=1 Tax=Gigaspora margarita TaxID=4874 RepID=A0A8H3WVK3_GIGMA|nr:hypothetical protein F8M41_016575 [Gigaspora margarita]
MIETQDTVAPINNRIRARKPNGNRKGTKKEKHVNCNASIDVDKSDSNLSEENIGSTLNVSKMIETQDTVAPINNRIRARKPNGNRKGTKKEKHVNCNASIDVDKSDSNLSEENIGSTLNVSEMIETQDTVASINNRIRARKSKGNYVDHNASIDIDESNQSLSEKNIGSALNDSEMLEIQDITAPTIKKTKARRPNDNSKKRKHIDHTAPANVDDSDPTLLEKNIKLAKIQDTVAPANHRTKACNDNSKKDHNILINDGNPRSLLNVGEILDTQDTTAPNNNRSNARKPNANGNSKKAKKGKHVNHNVSINVDDGDTALSEKNIGRF